MNLFTDIQSLEKVIEDNILPYLGWNDLLRFRRVSKMTKRLTDHYINLNPKLAPEIEINEGTHSLEQFLIMDIPTTRIFINNTSGYEFYWENEEAVAEFLHQFGPLVKHLRLHELSVHIFGKEWDFLEALTNLESVEARSFGFGFRNDSNVELEAAQVFQRECAMQDPRYVRDILPPVFKSLRSLKIGQNKNMVISNLLSQSSGTLAYSQMLEYAALPFGIYIATVSSLPFSMEFKWQSRLLLGVSFTILRKHIQESPGQLNLKIYDFISYHDDSEEAFIMEAKASPYFLELCALCKDPPYNVKLMNVGATWFLRRTTISEFNTVEIADPVVSLVGMHTSVVPLSMPNLERIEIRQTSRSCVGPLWKEERQDWPALKELDITVDLEDNTNDLTNGGNVPSEEIIILFDFFFQDIFRPALTELHLKFSKNADGRNIPKVEDIVTSCPNLKRLTVARWPGTENDFTTLWKGLCGLEEISLEYCKDLGSIAFVGEDDQNPVFLKLTNLKVLSLKGLDHMPKITDTVFSLVLRHMKLSKLILTSDAPVNSVTTTGILQLLQGRFAETIEKFPFSDWSLNEVSPENFKKLEMKFRSYYMI